MAQLASDDNWEQGTGSGPVCPRCREIRAVLHPRCLSSLPGQIIPVCLVLDLFMRLLLLVFSYKHGFGIANSNAPPGVGADRYHTCRRQVGWGPWPTSKGAVSHPPANGCRGWPEFLIEGGKADLNADFLKLRITVRVRPSKSMGCARPLKILENRKKKKKSEDNNQASSATRVGILVFESSCLEKFHPRFFFFFF